MELHPIAIWIKNSNQDKIINNKKEYHQPGDVQIVYQKNRNEEIKNRRKHFNKITKIKKEIFLDIMKVGGVAALNSISIATTMLVTTTFISKYGTEAIAGYGVCARLEQTLIPLAFGIGGVLTSAVGTNFGAEQFSRARKAAWLGALLIGILAGLIGMTVFISPSLWLDFFTTNPEAYIIGALYLGIVGPFFPIFAFGKTLYFASQGTGNMIIPIFGGITRLVIVSIIGFISVSVVGKPNIICKKLLV